MTGVEIAFLAQVFLGVSLIIDKAFFGEHQTIRVVPYVFWIAIMSCFGFIFYFFGFTMPGTKALIFSFLAGLSFILMLLSYYEVLSRGEASEAAPVVGGFAPVMTFILGSFIIGSSLNTSEVIAFILLILGGFILFFSERADLAELLPWTILAALFTATTNILEKIVFDQTANFVTGYALMKTATFLIGLLMLAVPSFRRNILSSSKSTSPKNRFLYFGNRTLAGLGAILVFYAIKLERNPAMIESINGFRYIIVFAIAFICTKYFPSIIKEDMHLSKVIEKVTATVLIVTGLGMLGLQRHYESLPIPAASEVHWGVTFSELMAEDLKLDPDETLRAIIKDLKPGGIRLVAYWNRIEPQRGQYNFKSLDSQMLIASKANVDVILAIGQRVPRWPECHIPKWAKPEKDLIPYVRNVVKRYRGYKNILYWQVENEPFLRFGECKRANKKLIEAEIANVQRLDPGRKILLTDGGEFGDWYRAAKRGSIFGTTLYRKVFNKYLGQFTYPITPEIYPFKRDIIKFLTKKPDQNFIIIELGTEPWGDKQIVEMTLNEQLQNFSVRDFMCNIDYALKSRFDTYYLWGAEWWYYLKKVKGIKGYWKYAAEVFQSGKMAKAKVL